MRIVCDNCTAKYQISDEKVRNKVFKIRCKKCSHVIVVRANQPEEAAAPAAEEATRVAEHPAPQQEPPADAIWYVVINREQVGPLTREQVDEHFRNGDVDADTFTWAEGMADWIRLAAVPEFAHHAPAPAPSSEPEPAAPAASGGGASIFAGVDEPDDVMVSNNQSAASESLFGGADEEEFSQSPRVSSGQALRGQRNENSVLFSLDSLASEAEAAPRVSNTGGAEGSGLIDISALAAPAATAGPKVSDDAFGGGAPAFAPVSAAPVGAGMPTFVTQKKSNTGKIALMVAAGILLLGGAVFATMHFMKGDDDKKPAVAQNDGEGAARVAVAGNEGAKPAEQPAKPAAAKAEEEKPAEEKKPEEAPAEAEAKAEESPEEKAEAEEKATAEAKKPAARRRRARRRASPAPSRPAARAEDAPPAVAAAPRRPAARPKPKPSKGKSEVDDLLGALEGGGSKPAARPAGGSAPAAAPARDPMLPEKLSRTQILTVVKRGAGKIRGCKSRDPGASGTVMVNMLINRNGQVSSAKAGGKWAGSPVGSCVESQVRTFRFPQFSGDPMRLKMPFQL